jgi:S-DNA-T family DNA segregation ATPase FtsK/SpoIIIE
MSRVALLIATTDYIDSGLRLLRSPASDARRLAALLEDESIGYFDQVIPLVNDSKGEIEEHIERTLCACAPDDMVLVYLSCHGIRDAHGRLFFTTVRTRRELPESTAISARFIEEQMSRCRAHRKVLLLDCCFGGAYVQGMEPFAADDGELSVQAAGKGTYVMTASDVLEFAYEGEQMKNRSGPFRSVFTEAVIDGLSTGRADVDNDGVITAHEMFQHIERHVRESGVPQTPTEFRSGVQGNIPIAKAALWHRGSTVDADPFAAESLALGDLLPALTVSGERGLCAPDWPPNGRFAVPIGRMYDPGSGLQETLTLDLSGGAPHVGVVGGMWSGKTSVLRTLACSLALTHTPDEVQIYALHGEPDGLARLGVLPHVGMVADYAEHWQVKQLVDGLVTTMKRREQACTSRRIRSPRRFRSKRLRGEFPGETNGEIFLLIDSWRDFSTRYPEQTRQLLQVAQQGVYYGIHLAVSAGRWRDLPQDLALHLSTWLELALADPRESRIDSGLAGGIPPGQPGFALTRGRRYVRLAVPALSGRTEEQAAGRAADGLPPEDEADEGRELDALLERIATAWSGARAAPLDVRPQGGENPVVLLDLLPAVDQRVDVPALWAATPPSRRLTTPIGVDHSGAPVVLDIKESVRGGSGPHGLCVGATGSGKSELLRTFALGLAATHAPESLNFVFVDFKGGATFSGMAHMPHVAGAVTNLADDPGLVDRLRDTLSGELNRRQELLRRAGNYANVTDYEKARAAGAALEPMPSLVLVIDEFGELLDADPDFIEILVSVGRIGRSLGVHMLLAAQRLEEGRLRGLETFLSYRIGLRTFTAAGSRAVLGTPDAYHLPPVPGSGLLKVDEEHVIAFRAAYSSGRSADEAGESPLDVLVRQMAVVPPVRQVWLPPLEEPPSLDRLLPPLSVVPERGLTAPYYSALGRLVVPVGLSDKPFEQRRDLLYLDFTGAAGHGLFVGGPQSGKSTLLSTLLLSFALTHTPDEARFYCLDFGGGSLSWIEELPHVGGVANRLDAEKVRRTVRQISTILADREARQSGREGGDVFLIIDGWATFTTDYETLADEITDIARRGLAVGVHLVLTASRYGEVRPALRDLLQNRVELRLGDPFESEVSRRAAASVPAAMPGRGLSTDRLHVMTALPRIDGASAPADLAAATAAATRQVKEYWSGEPAPAVRLLPSMLDAAHLPKGSDHPDHGVAFGVGESSLRPLFADFETDPLFVVFGESESGKSALLRLLIKQITERYTPAKAKIVVGDYRRAHLQGVPEAHLLRYCAAAPALQEALEEVAGAMSRRMPGPDVTPEQLRNRSWYDAPDAFVVIDDYELVATGQNPLTPLLEYLPFARDVGLRVILARSSGGASRALYEPVMQRMKELGAQGVVLSGDRSEGALLGNITPSQLPPGRGYFQTRRRGGQLVQTGWVPANN